MDKPTDDSDLARASALAGELRVVLGKLKRRLRDQMHMGDLTWSQTSALRRLERDGPATITVLARDEGMRPQSMGANVAVLEAAGLVSGAPDPQDGRQVIWSLTPTCHEWMQARRAARQDWLMGAIQAHLTASEQETLAGAVELLKRLAECADHE
jgi:DNA-binding MarR family transcriptional regulator